MKRGVTEMKIIGITGWSGAGKTTLLVRLIPALIGRGLSVSTLKHAHHAFDTDQPGKDSYQHRMAGADEVLVSSGRRFALIRELRDEPEWSLPALLGKLSPVDLVLIEGFKRERHPKIEVFRSANGKPPLHPGNDSIRAIIADCAFPDAARPVLPFDDIAAIADAVLRHAMPVSDVFGEIG